MKAVTPKKFMWGIVIAVIVAAGVSYIALTYFQGVPVLNYHQVNDKFHTALTLSSLEFEAQMKYLHDAGYTAISPDQLTDYIQEGKELPHKPVLITFDDGYEDNYQVAYPIMQKYHFGATIFIITDFVDKYDRYLTWAQIKEMKDNGFDFESHTLSHISLSKASDEKVIKQLVQSKRALEWRLGSEVKYLAYPGGDYDQRIVELTKKAGYRAAFTVNFGRDKENSTLYTLNRIPVFGGVEHTFFRFWLRLQFTQIVNALQNLKAYLLKEGNTSLAGYIYIP
ncbi:putative membrane protein [Propionispora sp. 2/2-37]|uniref:polysaccharide deacetylase family protein n=1 Tax=Propionispora sp. 2/2-37 TaxID=1677858 RepID=UPI0006C5448F|nr:polysaccharide deacetylase family protein [Propionispora sp. 2/2-37]CUH97317.1 putative membrane protein [Propionispora sp. 2/2-37]